jgi:hypothetical protein
MVDAKNTVWRWRPANSSGKGTINKVRVAGSAEWGDDVLAIGTFIRDAEANLYNLYVIDPSEQQILAYSPAADGSGFPTSPQGRLSAPRDVSHITDLYIDGDIWVADNGQMLRLVGGKAEGWQAATPGDETLRGDPAYRLITSGSARREGTMYGYDPQNQRVVALSKVNGAYIGQYRLADGDTGWSDLRSWYVEPGLGGEPDALVWISKDTVHRAILEASTSVPGASGAPGETGGASPGPSH